MPTLAAPRILAIGGGYTRPTIRFSVSKMKLTPPEIRAVLLRLGNVQPRPRAKPVMPSSGR